MKISSTQQLSALLIFTGFIILSIGAIIRKISGGSDFEVFVEGFILVIGIFVWGCTGIVWIMQKEVPQFVPVRGKGAVLLGYLMIISCWGMAIYGLLLILLRVF
jgi:hypothetical protein